MRFVHSGLNSTSRDEGHWKSHSEDQLYDSFPSWLTFFCEKIESFYACVWAGRRAAIRRREVHRTVFAWVKLVYSFLFFGASCKGRPSPQRVEKRLDALVALASHVIG